MGKRLYVGNLAYSVTEAELRDVFAEVGNVAEVKVVLDRDTGRPRGFAFVEMSTDAEAADAMSKLNGSELQGRSMNIKEAQERSGGGGGGAWRWLGRRWWRRWWRRWLGRRWWWRWSRRPRWRRRRRTLVSGVAGERSRS